MRVRSIDHINITGPRALLEACVAFYTEVLGMRVGERPAFRSEGFWLYAGDAAIVHLTVRGEGLGARGESGALDHVALACENVEEAQRRLNERGIPFTINHVRGTNQVQLFVTDPAGLRLELNFRQ